MCKESRFGNRDLEAWCRGGAGSVCHHSTANSLGDANNGPSLARAPPLPPCRPGSQATVLIAEPIAATRAQATASIRLGVLLSFRKTYAVDGDHQFLQGGDGVCHVVNCGWQLLSQICFSACGDS